MRNELIFLRHSAATITYNLKSQETNSNQFVQDNVFKMWFDGENVDIKHSPLYQITMAHSELYIIKSSEFDIRLDIPFDFKVIRKVNLTQSKNHWTAKDPKLKSMLIVRPVPYPLDGFELKLHFPYKQGHIYLNSEKVELGKDCLSLVTSDYHSGVAIQDSIYLARGAIRGKAIGNSNFKGIRQFKNNVDGYKDLNMPCLPNRGLACFSHNMNNYIYFKSGRESQNFFSDQMLHVETDTNADLGLELKTNGVIDFINTDDGVYSAYFFASKLVIWKLQDKNDRFEKTCDVNIREFSNAKQNVLQLKFFKLRDQIFLIVKLSATLIILNILKNSVQRRICQSDNSLNKFSVIEKKEIVEINSVDQNLTFDGLRLTKKRNRFKLRPKFGIVYYFSFQKQLHEVKIEKKTVYYGLSFILRRGYRIYQFMMNKTYWEMSKLPFNPDNRMWSVNIQKINTNEVIGFYNQNGTL